MKIKIFKNKKSFKKGGFHTNPDNWWEIVLVIALIVVLALFVLGFYLFRKTNKELTVPEPENNEQIETVTRERIEKALEYFSEREKKSTEILNSPSPIIDPSL